MKEKATLGPGPVPVPRVLDGAKAADLEDVLVIGWEKNGELYGGCSTGETAVILELMERLKFKLLNGDYN